jgi:DNA invertase Pin-like site-specific DNA recombinase
MDNQTIYDRKVDGYSLKLKPKAAFSGDYKERKNLRVAAYIRVSTDKKEQESSFETQYKHYDSFIKANPNWIFAGIYSDTESGTSKKKRVGFNQMEKDAKAGKFDMIITKSVSRYARNLVDGIQTARDLLTNNPPVGIMFEDENLNTFRPDCEFMLSVMLLVAQGESEKRSKAIRQAFVWRCEDNNFPTPTKYLLGYTEDGEREDGKGKRIIIEPEGAKTVKAIFAMYLYGMTASKIAYILTSSKKRTAKNNDVWSSSSVLNILKNEKMCGDAIGQKNVTTNMLEHKTEKNIGQAHLHYLDNNHEGIVSRDEYIRALLLMRANCSSCYYNPRYEIEIVREGLLAGFIPLNFAFGGYEAEHYLGAEAAGGVELDNYALDILNAPDYRLIRLQEIEHKLAAQLTISYKDIIFNSDCISRLPNVEYVEILLHPSERLIAVRPATPDNRNAVLWKSNISSALICPVIFALMGWNSMWKYKIIADCFERGYGRILMFNLSDPEFQIIENISDNENIKKRIRKLLQLEKWRNDIGADYISRIVASRRAYALTLNDWKLNALAKPVKGFNGNPVNRSEEELKEYLAELGVNYV